MEPCSYQFQADKIEKMTQDLQTLQRYAGSQQIAWMLGAATGCIVSTAGMNLVFRNPKTGVVRECSLEEITSLEKLDASEIDIAKLGKEVPTDDLELYMRYQKEGSIEHFTDSEKKTISRIETMGIKGDECEEILRARGREFNRPPREEPEVVLPPRNESGTETDLFLPDEFYNKNLPNQVAPGTKYLPKYDELGNVKQIKMYDDYGREIGWVDYTNHGYGDINSPHYHTTPHWHEKIYNAQYPDGIKINHRTDVNTPLGDK